MKPILIHCHIYYPKLWKEFKECILNISALYRYKLFVTMVEKNSDIEDDIMKNFPNNKIEIVDNRGYDIGPFIHVLNQVNLDEYSYIIKLHTKRNVESKKEAIRQMYGSIWRENLLIPFKNKYIKKIY